MGLRGVADCAAAGGCGSAAGGGSAAVVLGAGPSAGLRIEVFTGRNPIQVWLWFCLWCGCMAAACGCMGLCAAASGCGSAVVCLRFVCGVGGSSGMVIHKYIVETHIEIF